MALHGKKEESHCSADISLMKWMSCYPITSLPCTVTAFEVVYYGQYLLSSNRNVQPSLQPPSASTIHTTSSSTDGSVATWQGTMSTCSHTGTSFGKLKYMVSVTAILAQKHDVHLTTVLLVLHTGVSNSTITLMPLCLACSITRAMASCV